MNYYEITTQAGHQCWVSSDKHLKPSEIKDAAEFKMLERIDEYGGRISDPFLVVMESEYPGEKKEHLIQDYSKIPYYCR